MDQMRGDRFFRATRGRVVLLLRRGERTVNDLAAALGLTDNAVRAQLVALERDGLVTDTGTQPGARRPHVTYALTAEAERLFPKAYEPVLCELLAVLGRRLTPQRLDGALRAVGRRLGGRFDRPASGAPLRERVRAAVGVLGELGGLADVEEDDGGRVAIRGYSCPLRAAVDAHPGACRVAEGLLGEIVGAPVRERCDKGESPRCRFEVSEQG